MNESKSSSKVYIITFVVIVLVLIIMFVLLYMADRASKRIYVPETTKAKEKTEAPVIVTNFSTPLSLIIGDIDFTGNYDYEIRHSGAKFLFKCQKYDEKKQVCLEGSANMNVGTANITLFEYKDENNNYFEKSSNYYIIVNDDNIILVSDGIENESGIAKVLSRNGKDIMKIDKIITGYKQDGEYYGAMYPVVDGNNLNYYMCEKGKVKIVRTDLTNKDNFEIIQNVEDGICD